MLSGVMTALLIVSGIDADFSFNLSQSYFNKAWQGDEVGSITWTSLLNASYEEVLSNFLEFENEFKFAFGQTYSQDFETGEWNPPKKSTDEIENESVLRFSLGWLVDPYISLRGETQLIDGENALYLNPLSLTEAFGFARTIVEFPEFQLNSRLGLAFKEEYSRGGEETTTEGGVEWVSWTKYSFAPGSEYSAELRVFKALYSSQSDKLNEHWKSPDFEFDSELKVGFLKYLQFLLTIKAEYDREEIDRVQIKENMAIGLILKLL